MKPYFLLAALLSFATVLSAQNKDEVVLKKLNESWINAYPNRDTATLNRILAADFILINPAGTKMTKAAVLHNTAFSQNQILTAKVDTVEVRLLHDVGIVNAKASFTFKSGDKETSGKTCYMDVYEKRAGKWVAVAAHVSSLE